MPNKRKMSTSEEHLFKKFKYASPEITEDSVENMSKYDQTFILGMHHLDGKDSDEDREYIVYCCNNLKRKYDSSEHPCQVAFYDIKQDIYPDLTNLTSQSRLILVGHGTYMAEANMAGFAGRDAEQVIEAIFEDCDLHEAKALKFISCKLGSGVFLDQMKSAIEAMESGPVIMPQITGYNTPLYVSLSGEIYADCAEEGIEIAKRFKIKK